MLFCLILNDLPVLLETVLIEKTRGTNLGLHGHHRFWGELDLSSFQNGVFLEDILLRLVVTKWLWNENKQKNDLIRVKALSVLRCGKRLPCAHINSGRK